MTTAALTPAQQALADINQAFQALLGRVLVDAVEVGSPIVINYLTNVQQNPAVANIVAQQALLLAALPLALPNLEAQVAKDASTIGIQLLAQLKALVVPAS